MARKRRQPEDDNEEEYDIEQHDGDSHEGIQEEDNEEEDHDRRGKKKKKKKKKRFQIMSSSNQTEADRRVLRRRQRELQNDIVMGVARGNNAAVDGKDANSGEVGRLREQNNELWQNVHYTREAVLDSENVDLITNKAAREAEKIVQVTFFRIVHLLFITIRL